MAAGKKRRQSRADAPYRASHNSANLSTSSRRASLRSTISTHDSAAISSDDPTINEPPSDFDETIATLKSAAESFTVRVLQETADEQARAIRAMRSTIDAKDSRIQKLNRKIGRRDKTVDKLRKRMERVNTESSKANLLKSEVMVGLGTKDYEMMKALQDKRSPLPDGLCTKCGENCIRLVKENQQLRDRLHEVDGLCTRLRTENNKLDGDIRGLERNLKKNARRGNQ